LVNGLDRCGDELMSHYRGVVLTPLYSVCRFVA
jgi:hypothetical protein